MTVFGAIVVGAVGTAGAFTVWAVRWLRGYGRRWR